jgi:hypothetical protein
MCRSPGIGWAARDDQRIAPATMTAAAARPAAIMADVGRCRNGATSGAASGGSEGFDVSQSSISEV